jgi:hypothetical protein
MLPCPTRRLVTLVSYGLDIVPLPIILLDDWTL